jgi:hypothetical protein
MLHRDPLPEDIQDRLKTLGQALQKCEGVVFASLFGGAATGRIEPLSDVDVAVYLVEGVDAVEGKLEAMGAVTAHLRTDEVDVVVLNEAPTALTGRILQTRRVILDREPFRRHRFESQALREFLDFRIFEHRILAQRYARVDRDLILRKLADLDQYLGQVSEYGGITVEAYRADWKNQRIVERTLQMAIEVCLDIAALIIADRRLRVPTKYAEAFEVLGEAGPLQPTQRDVLMRMSRFRNLLVHEYARLDPAMVVRILREHLKDLTAFKTAVLGWI